MFGEVRANLNDPYTYVEVTKDASRVYSFLYAEFVVPLVKAVPELATKYHEKIKDDETTINEIVGKQKSN